jgi:hypothetical protein
METSFSPMRSGKSVAAVLRVSHPSRNVNGEPWKLTRCFTISTWRAEDSQGFYDLPDESYLTSRTLFKWILVDWYPEQPVGLRLPTGFKIAHSQRFEFALRKGSTPENLIFGLECENWRRLGSPTQCSAR